MKTIIYYFSGTGNNLAVAKKLGQLLGDTDLKPFSELADKGTIPEAYQWICFCVPSYYSHIPPYVKECLNHITFHPEQKIASIVCCGGNRGLAVQDLRQCVEQHGGKVQIETMIVLPGNYILSYDAFPEGLQRLEEFFANYKIKKTAERIKKNGSVLLTRPGLFYQRKQEPRLQKAIQQYSEIGKNYVVNTDCVQCGICAKVCPVDNIELIHGKVTFFDHCNQCMACVQWCPNHAIDYQGKAAKHKRYHNSTIHVMDMYHHKME